LSTLTTDPAATTGGAQGFVPLVVAAVDRLTPDSVAVTFDVPDSQVERFRFRPGQHLTLRRVVDGAELRRTYSVCTSAANGRLRVAVKKLEGGAFSPWFTGELQAGDCVQALPPAGSFGPRVDPTRRRRYGLLAAGSGITPVLSILATVLEVEPGSEVFLVYGNRTQADAMFVDELADLKDRYLGRLQVLHVLSREDQGSELLFGRIDAARLARLFDTLLPPDDVDEWYLCGPLAMVTEARVALLAAGADPACVHTELFYAEAPASRPRREGARSGTSTVTAMLNGRSSTVRVDPTGGSILEAVLATRPDAPYACRGGVCGTCRARVSSGSVEMDVNYALEPEEISAGVVLTCQSHPTTPKVVLEYLT